MDSAYFKRFRMDLPLTGALTGNLSPAGPVAPLPEGYRLVPWHDGLLDAHARTKFRSFKCR